LRQSKKLAAMHAAWHQVIAGALRCGASQDRGLNLGESEAVQAAADGPVHARADPQVLLHARAAQVQITVLKTDFLTVLIGHQKGHRGRGVQQFDPVGNDLDLAGRHGFVPLAFGPHPDLAADAHAKFVAQALSRAECRAVRVHHHLDDAAVVAQTDEDQPPQIPAPVHPAAQSDIFIGEVFGHLAAKLCSHRYFPDQVAVAPSPLVLPVLAAGLETELSASEDLVFGDSFLPPPLASPESTRFLF
jgi:hypothetical protein